MDKSKKSEIVESAKAEPTPEGSPVIEQPAVEAPVFSLERLRRDCFRVFGITTSTFDAATYGLTGEFTVAELRDRIQAFQKTRVFPADKGGN